MSPLLFVSMLTAISSTCLAQSATTEISSCIGLQRELKNTTGAKILLLTANLHCVANEWLEPIRLSRDVTVRGNRSETLYRLDLTRLHPGIVIENAASLTLDKLVLYNLPPMTEVFDLSFVKAKPGATISMMRSYVEHPKCLNDVDEMLSRSRVYHLCGTWFVCGNDRIAYGLDTSMDTACSTVRRDLNEGETVRDDGSINNLTVVFAVVCLFSALTSAVLLIVMKRRCRGRDIEGESLSEREALTLTSVGSSLSLSFSTRVVRVDGEFTVNLDHQLGVGGFGTVYAGSYQSASAAVKVIKSWDVPKGHDLEAEANLTMTLKHPNVVTCLGSRRLKLKELFGEQHPQGEDLCSLIFMECCDKDELSRAIDRGEYVINFKTLQPKICAVLHSALDIAKGLQYLHSIGIIHGDIKPDNILRKTDKLDPRGYTCKICDFGLSKKETKKMTASDTLGMISYMPPEMLRLGEMGPFTDVYSFGMVLWEMITSDVPYSEVDYAQILSEAVRGRRPEIPESTPYRIASLIEQCWNADYLQRPTADALVEDLVVTLSEWYASFPEGSVVTCLPRRNSHRLRTAWHSDYDYSEMPTVSTEAIRSINASDDIQSGRRSYSIWTGLDQNLTSVASTASSIFERRGSIDRGPSRSTVETSLSSVHIDDLLSTL